MRSRYSAFAYGDSGYLFRTWHPRTRPADVAVVVAWRSVQSSWLPIGLRHRHG
ncbi:YchJ family metal-binding protein [Mycobacterium sp. 1165178.9]|uniref:YchJ family metal-binding protein n=1 Tax=Mycobacterium sp. 1165178.9 TaxID=1834070 RepID=UPI0026D1860C